MGNDFFEKSDVVITYKTGLYMFLKSPHFFPKYLPYEDVLKFLKLEPTFKVTYCDEKYNVIAQNYS